MIRVGMFIEDRYEILEKIGSGGMSDVYKAKCHKLNRFVAIKFLKPEFCEDKNFVAKFQIEAQSAAALLHPNVVSVYDVNEYEGVYYIVMEYVDGITLKQYIDRNGRLPIKEATSIAIQIGQGIEAAHNANIIHESEPDSPIESYDLSSSYPSVLMSERYPYEFRRSDPDLLWLFLKHNQACLMHIYMEDVHLRIDEWGCPYIPKAKCESITGGIFDNGRVIQCATCEMYITEIDFAIILQEYDFQYQVIDLWTANKRLLPEAFRKLLLKTYKEKTELKGGDNYLYGKKKGLFNSYY